MPAQEEAVRGRMPLERLADDAREPHHVLVVLDDRNPFAMLVCLDPAQPFEHLEAGDRETVTLCRRAGENRSPNRMRVEHGTGISTPNDLDVQQRLGGRFADAIDRQSELVYGEDVGVLKQSFVDRARCDRQPERVTAHDRAEIAAGAEYPASVVEPAPDCRDVMEDRGHHRETSWRVWR